jgi:hypothetical protein
VRGILSGIETHSSATQAASKPKRKYVMSAEARGRIAEAQRLRWAKQKRAARAVSTIKKTVTGKAAKNVLP